MANFPIRFQFAHEDATYDAILLEDSPAATGVCCLCEKSLQGRRYYVTVPFLFHMHADCAVAEFTSAGHDDERSRGLHHGEGSGSRHYYDYYPPPSGPYGWCPPPPPPPLQQNYSYSNPADQYSGQYYYYPPPSGPYGWCPPPLHNHNYSYSNPSIHQQYSYPPPPPSPPYHYPHYCYQPPPSTQYNNSTATQPQEHKTKPSVTSIISKFAIGSCLKALFVAMFL